MSDKDKKFMESVKKWLEDHFVPGGTDSVSIELKENTGKIHRETFSKK